MIDIIWQADFQQALFRQLLESWSRPGNIASVADYEQQMATAVLATLTDQETSLADPDGYLSELEMLRLKVRPADADQAAFVICDGSNPVAFTPLLGSLTSPEQGATLVIRVKELNTGTKAYQLSGPGIETTVNISPVGLDDSWIQQREIWNSNFPMGVDMLLCSDVEFMAIPRTTKIRRQN